MARASNTPRNEPVRSSLTGAIREKARTARWKLIRPALRLPPAKMLALGQIGDGREQALANHVVEHTPPANVDAVIEAMDEFARRCFLMNVGDEKGAILERVIGRASPTRLLELGTYCGYSALRTARAMGPTARLWSVEANPGNADVARRILAHADVEDRVTVVVGRLGDDGATLARLRDEYGFGDGCVDFVFIDHSKSAYLSDLRLLSASGLLRPGSVVVADNVKAPGVPDYLAFVRAREGIEWHTTEHRAHFEYRSKVRDLVTESVYLGARA